MKSFLPPPHIVVLFKYFLGVCTVVTKFLTQVMTSLMDNLYQVKLFRQLIREAMRTPLTVVAATLEDTFFVELPEELRDWTFDRQRCTAFNSTTRKSKKFF